MYGFLYINLDVLFSLNVRLLESIPLMTGDQFTYHFVTGELRTQDQPWTIFLFFYVRICFEHY
jgi:hypothetical protein